MPEGTVTVDCTARGSGMIVYPSMCRLWGVDYEVGGGMGSFLITDGTFMARNIFGQANLPAGSSGHFAINGALIPKLGPCVQFLNMALLVIYVN